MYLLLVVIAEGDRQMTLL